MTTNAELRAAAELMLALKQADVSGEQANVTRERLFPGMSDAVALATLEKRIVEMCSHILATVRDDDDDELSDGFLSDMGFVSAVDDKWSLGQITVEIGNGDSDVWIGDEAHRVCVKNRRQFRSLMDGLGAPLPAAK